MLAKKIVILAGISFLTLAGIVWAQAVGDSFIAQGEKLLQNGDFNGALQAFGEAVKTDRENADYRTEYLILRRVIKAREGLAAEENVDKWEASAKSLRRYYYQHNLYAEALKIDTQMYDKKKTEENAVLLAESQIENGADKEALELLQAQDAGKIGAAGRVLLALASGRTGNAPAALSALKACDYKDATGDVYFLSARAKALAGDQDSAAADLVKAFEMTPPSRLKDVKAAAQVCADLQSIQETDAYKKALQTDSKISESGCSGGSSCGSCQNKATCGGKK